MGTVGYTGNGLLTSVTILIFTLNQNEVKGISKKDIWKGWSAANTANFINNV